MTAPAKGNYLTDTAHLCIMGELLRENRCQGGAGMYESTVERTMLFDFFGELLTEKQRTYFDLHYNADLSLAEIAEQEGISRQGVWDIIRRAEATLRHAEEKT